MMHEFHVTPAPAPVMPTKISINIKYIVVRGDGQCKLLYTLYGPDKDQPWSPLASKVYTPQDILIPVDIFTAARLGLVDFNELELPEGMKALINMIK